MEVAASTGAAHEIIMRPNLIKHEENFVRDFVYEMINIHNPECLEFEKTVTKRSNFVNGNNSAFYN